MGLQRRSKVNAEFNMASLTDIIFLLLIFFMLTSTLVSPNALNLKLPSSNAKTVAPSRVPVSITKDGQFYLDGNTISPDNLMSLIGAKVAQEGGNPKDVTVTIVAELGVPIEDVVKVMDVAMKLGCGAILATDAGS